MSSIHVSKHSANSGSTSISSHTAAAMELTRQLTRARRAEVAAAVRGEASPEGGSVLSTRLPVGVGGCDPERPRASRRRLTCRPIEASISWRACARRMCADDSEDVPAG
eukprot:scaffold102147_cov29-Tisochrysis_lutea.AAC.6